jgi:hypothetical protein
MTAVPTTETVTVRERYDRFISMMVYGERMEFSEAMKTVAALVDDTWQA